MANKRADKLDKNIKAGENDLKRVIGRSRRAVKGIVAGSVSPDFIRNTRLRNRLYGQLVDEYKNFNDDINNWSLRQGETTARDFFAYAKDDVPSGAGIATFGAFSAKYLEDMVAQVNPSVVSGQVAINSKIGGMLDEEIRALRSAVSTTMAEGAVEGLNNKQMADRMLKKASQVSGKFQFVDKAGKRWQADNYFGMLNRTLHAEVARNTYINEATNEAGLDLYVVAGGVTGSSADNPDDPCDAWAGRVMSYTGATGGYPTYADAQSAGVFHPNCVHFVRVALPSEVGRSRVGKADRSFLTADRLGVA